MSARLHRGLAAAAVTGVLALSPVVLLGPVGAAAATCTPTVAQATLEVEEGPVQLGGTVTVSGAGWCHPSDGGSRVAIKLHEGAYARLDTSLHKNQTIWAIVDADPVDGTFSFQMQLPDGTAATSTPAFETGEHTLRALTGSIKPGDEVRSVESGRFVVGAYKPNGTPDPLSSDDLTPETEDGAIAVRTKSGVLVSVRGGRAGDWVLASLLTKDGSSRYPWGTTWVQLDDDGRVLLPAEDKVYEGEYSFVVQDGNRGHVAELRGWTTLTFPSSGMAGPGGQGGQGGTTNQPGTPGSGSQGTGSGPGSGKGPTGKGSRGPKSSGPSSTGATPGGTATPSSTGTPLAAPATTPVAGLSSIPVAGAAVLPAGMPTVYRGWSSMKAEDELAASLDGDVLRVQLGYASAGTPGTAPTDVFVHVVTATGQQAAGWTVAAQGGEVVLDLRDLADGDYRFSLQDSSGKALGWAAATLSTPEAASADATADDLRATSQEVDQGLVGERDLWLSGLGVVLLAGLGAGVGLGRRTARPTSSETQGDLA